MRNKETGEFELVIGNGQLLSGFFIVVLLLVVTFAMGYVVGQNSPRAARPQGDSLAAAAQPAPIQTQQQAAPPASPPPQPAAEDTSQPPADTPPQPVTKPAQEEAPAVPSPSASSQTSPGVYLQLGAWKQASAPQELAQTLKDKGYPVAVETGADTLIHLMVGPYTDAQAANAAKKELETKLALHPFLVRK